MRKGFFRGCYEIFVPNKKIKKPFRPTEIIEVKSDIDWVPGQNTRTIASRVITCVNACMGMADPAKEIEELKNKASERDELDKDVFALLQVLKAHDVTEGVLNARQMWEALSGRTVSCARCNERAKAEAHPMDRPWIGVDLDGTLAHYDEWRGIEHIGPPIEEMRLRVKQWLDEGQEVRILTARVGPQRQDLPHPIAEITQHIEAWCLTHLGQVLRVTSQKDYCMVAFWDDRCVQVVPNTGRSLVEKLADTENELLEERRKNQELRDDLNFSNLPCRKLFRRLCVSEAAHARCISTGSQKADEIKRLRDDVALLNQRLATAEDELKAERMRWAEAERDAVRLAECLVETATQLCDCKHPACRNCQRVEDAQQALEAHEVRLKRITNPPASSE